jgi:hypothetical protein
LLVLGLASIACSSSSSPDETPPATTANALSATVALSAPIDVSVDPNDDVWVIDDGSPQCSLVKISKDGSSLRAAQFACEGYTAGMAFDATGTVFVALERSILRVTPDGVVTTIASAAPGSGYDPSATFGQIGPGMRIDAAGNLHVIDTTIGQTRERRITQAGAVSTLFGVPATFGTFGNAYSPAGGWYSTIGDCVARDLGLGGVTAGNQYTPGSRDATGTAARFDTPQGIAFAGKGTFYIADANNDEIRKMTGAGVVTTLAGAVGQRGWTDGTGSAARFNAPGRVATDSTGNAYVTERNNRTIRKVTPTGDVSTFASPCGQGCGDGQVCTASGCSTCWPGATACGGIQCTNLSWDFENCGACGNTCGTWSTCSSGACVGTILNVDFGGSTTTKTGSAWWGLAGDVWNAVNTAALPATQPLVWRDGSPATGVNISATNLAGAWSWNGEKPVDPMYANYNYSWMGDSASVTFSGLPSGSYSVAVWGKQGKNNTGFFLTVQDASGATVYTSATQYTSEGADPTGGFQAPGQLVLFDDYFQLSTGMSLRINLLPGVQGDGNAGMIINGAQLLRW